MARPCLCRLSSFVRIAHRGIRKCVLTTAIPVLIQRGATAVAAGRVAIGLTALARPSLPSRPWVGATPDDLTARVFGRALGARDLALGLGALAALRNRTTGRPAPGWRRAHSPTPSTWPQARCPGRTCRGCPAGSSSPRQAPHRVSASLRRPTWRRRCERQEELPPPSAPMPGGTGAVGAAVDEAVRANLSRGPGGPLVVSGVRTLSAAPAAHSAAVHARVAPVPYRSARAPARYVPAIWRAAKTTVKAASAPVHWSGRVAARTRGDGGRHGQEGCAVADR